MHKSLLTDDYHSSYRGLYERAVLNGPPKEAGPELRVHGRGIPPEGHAYPGDILQRLNLSRGEAALQAEAEPRPFLSGDQTRLGFEPEPHGQSFPVRRTSLQEELVNAAHVYDVAISYMRRAMTLARQGVLHLDSAEQVVRGIVDSLRNNPDALTALPRIIQRDKYFYTHNVNVSILLAAFYIALGENEDEVVAASLAGLFHDLGMAFLPKSLLSSRKGLSATEKSLVTRHPVFGHSLLADAMGNMQPQVLLAVLEHHERYDGAGYPKGIGRNTISRIGHLTALADSYDALTSNRPYRKAVSPHRALCTMFKMSELQYHPVFLALFVRMLGIYPVGSIVELQDGYCGVVTRSNPANALLPVVTLVRDAEGIDMPYLECDLGKAQGARIIRSLNQDECGIDPLQVLGCSPQPGGYRAKARKPV